MRHRPSTLVAIAAATAVGAAACGSGDVGPPNPVDTTPVDPATSSTGGTGPGAGGGGGSTPPPTPRRTMQRRNPLGATLNNHLVDGDFELSVTFEGAGPQLGWLAFTNVQQGYVRTETGGLCRSGLRCGILPPGLAMFGRGTSAGPETPMEASIAIKPPPGAACSLVRATAIPCDFTGNQIALELTAPEPQADGWCELRATIEPQDEGLCLFVDTDEPFEGEFLLDDARFLPAPAATQMRRFQPMPPQRAKRLRAIHRRIRDRLPIGSGAPSASGALGRRPHQPPVGVK